MKNQNEKLKQVKEQLARNEAIVKEEEVIFDKISLGRGSCINAKQPPSEVVALWERNGRKAPRALPSKKKQYLFAEKLAYRYRRLYLKNPKLRALFYDGDNEKKEDQDNDEDAKGPHSPKAPSPLDQFQIGRFYHIFYSFFFIFALSSKKILIYNEEMMVACCFIGFIIFSRKSLGKTFKMTLDGRIQAIQEELQQFLNPNEVVLLESNEQQRLLRISLRICGTVVESLPMARCAPKCEKTVQAFLCRNLNVKLATLLNAISSRRIRLQDDLVTAFYLSVSERFVPGSTLKVSIVELIQEGLGVLKMVRVGGSLKNKENE